VQISQLPVNEQLTALRETLEHNKTLTEVLNRATELNLPNWYLTAGAIFQTIWNVVTNRPPTEGIKDYDLFYFEAKDLSWAAENKIIQTGRKKFKNIEVEIRNEARVHLWYEKKFGIPCHPYTSTEAAIDSFAATTCCIGIRVEPNNQWRVYAPHGLSDVFNLIIRPNQILAPQEVYETKTTRWHNQWPTLTVLPWQGQGSTTRIGDPA
jgi:uncharacterized protein